MNVTEWVGESLEYGRELVESAIQGAKDAGKEVGPNDKFPKALVKGAPSSLGLALLGAGVGVLCSYCGNKRKLTRESVAFGALGGIAGMLIGLGWSTRHLTNDLANGAMKNVKNTRDEHWLERHPIDYA